MDIVKAKKIRRVLNEYEDAEKFFDEIKEGTNLSEFATISLDLMCNGKYYPKDIKIKSMTLVELMNALLILRKGDLKKLK